MVRLNNFTQENSVVKILQKKSFSKFISMRVTVKSDFFYSSASNWQEKSFTQF